MAKNQVQFQKGLSLPNFSNNTVPTSSVTAPCSNGAGVMNLTAAGCGYNGFCMITTRNLYQCHHCHRQTTVTSGTIFEHTKLPLTTWFLGMYLLTQTKNGISGLELKRQLGIGYNAAWRMKHKILQVMMERDNSKPLSGIIQLDDAYWGGERHGGKRGRGASGKTPFVATVQTDEGGHPIAMRFTKLKGFRITEITQWARQHLMANSLVVSDGLSCFRVWWTRAANMKLLSLEVVMRALLWRHLLGLTL